MGEYSVSEQRHSKNGDRKRVVGENFANMTRQISSATKRINGAGQPDGAQKKDQMSDAHRLTAS